MIMADESGLFSPSNMSTLLAAAMVEKMTQAERDTMLAGALAYLMTPAKPAGSSYGTPSVTPVQAAFNQSAENVIRKVTYDHLENNPEFIAKVDAMVAEAVTVALATDSEFEAMIGRAVASAMSERHRGY